MKAIFYDASILQIQKVETSGGSVRFLVIGETPENLRTIFEDESKTKVIKVEERGQIIGTYENYTEYDHTELYPGGILGVVNNQVGKSTEERLSDVEGDVETAMRDIEEIKESGGAVPENYEAMTTLARMQAQTLTDNQALKVKSLYDTWRELVELKFTAKDEGYKFTHEDVLYKTIKPGQEFQEQWVPGQGTESIFTRIDETHSGTLGDPIPYAGNMELEEGKYYTQDGVTYLCNRYTGQAVFQPLRDLIGIYVEKVEEE